MKAFDEDGYLVGDGERLAPERLKRCPRCGMRHIGTRRKGCVDVLENLIRRAYQRQGANMAVRAKMTLSSVTEHTWGGKTLKFSTVYDAAIPEDQRFQKATPSGAIEMQVDNPAALAQFTLGKSYYVEFTEVA